MKQEIKIKLSSNAEYRTRKYEKKDMKFDNFSKLYFPKKIHESRNRDSEFLYKPTNLKTANKTNINHMFYNSLKNRTRLRPYNIEEYGYIDCVNVKPDDYDRLNL